MMINGKELNKDTFKQACESFLKERKGRVFSIDVFGVDAHFFASFGEGYLHVFMHLSTSDRQKMEDSTTLPMVEEILNKTFTEPVVNFFKDNIKIKYSPNENYEKVLKNPDAIELGKNLIVWFFLMCLFK